MSVMQLRGGIPRVFRDNIDATGRKHEWRFICNCLIARNQGATDLHLYFTKEDYDNTTDKYVVVPAPSANNPHGEWVGPVEAKEIWIKGDGGASDIELVVFQRRG